jgi:agmatine deiminase
MKITHLLQAALTLMCLCIDNASAQAVTPVPQALPDAVLRAIVDDSVSPPRGFTPEERANWRLPDLTNQPSAPPLGPVRALAEYEVNDGLLLRWGSFNSVVTEIAVAATRDSSVRLWIVVASTAQQSSASTTLQTAGANLAQISFVIAPTNSVWMRDYGPRIINMAGLRGSVDHTYNRNRPDDDAFPVVFANLLNEPKFDIPLVHGGGNFHLFSDGDAFMTELIRNENPALSAAQIQSYYQDYQGLAVTLLPAFPASFDSTQHIDMWMLPVADRRVIVSEYPSTGGVYQVPFDVTSSTSAELTTRGYTVFRTPGWRAGTSHYTYANAIVLNQQVLMCRFSGEDARNAQAFATFQQAFPGRSVTTIDCSSIITAAGAIHCIAMHVGQPFILRAGFE